jgi:two-component system, cell cycle response regulator DivK
MMMRNATTQTIMIVEDYDDTRLMVRLLLEKRGYRVLEADDGLKGVEIALREHPDLILMDLNMPSLDGFAATRRIREHAEMRDVPIVAFSGYGPEHFGLEALAAGCNAYLCTPIEPQQLDDLLGRLLSKRSE